MRQMLDLVESLPVEAKDCACEGKMKHFTYHSDESCGVDPIEPKPTPSTPARVGSVAAYIGITEDQIKRFVGAMNMVGLEIVEMSSLPQPDSSSIPEQTFEDIWKIEEEKGWVLGRLMYMYPEEFRYIARAFWNAAHGGKIMNTEPEQSEGVK